MSIFVIIFVIMNFVLLFLALLHYLFSISTDFSKRRLTIFQIFFPQAVFFFRIFKLQKYDKLSEIVIGMFSVCTMRKLKINKFSKYFCK